MRFKDYFAGLPFPLHSPLPAAEAAASIDREAGSALSPFTCGVVGGARFGHVRLSSRTSLFDNNTKPVLARRIFEAAEGSTLDLIYRAPSPVILSVPVYVLMLFVGIAVVIVRMSAGAASFDTVMLAIVMSLFLAAPWVMLRIATRRADEELALLLDFLARHAATVPVASSAARDGRRS
jgi:hypothetical protein